MEKGRRLDRSHLQGSWELRKGGRLYRMLLPTGPFKVSLFYLPPLRRGGGAGAREGRAPAKSQKGSSSGCEQDGGRLSNEALALLDSSHWGSPSPVGLPSCVGWVLRMGEV